MQTQYEPYAHSSLSSAGVEAGEGAKSGFAGGVRAGMIGTLLGALLIGGGLGYGAYELSALASGGAATAGATTTGWLSGVLGSWAPTIGSGVSSTFGFIGATGAPLIGIATGLLATVGSFLTPLPYILGAGLAMIGSVLGITSGVSRGEDRAAGEQRAAHIEQAHSAELAAYREMAQVRAKEAQANITAVQAFMAQQNGATTAGMSNGQVMPVEQQVTPPCAQVTDQPKANPLLQTEGTKINAATVAQMGLAAMPEHMMAKA